MCRINYAYAITKKKLCLCSNKVVIKGFFIFLCRMDLKASSSVSLWMKKVQTSKTCLQTEVKTQIHRVHQVVVPLFYSYSKLLNTLTKPQQNIIRKTLKKNLNCKRSRLVCGWRPRCKRGDHASLEIAIL